MNASVQALTEVDGIGIISAKKIREVLNAEVYWGIFKINFPAIFPVHRLIAPLIPFNSGVAAFYKIAKRFYCLTWFPICVHLLNKQQIRFRSHQIAYNYEWLIYNSYKTFEKYSILFKTKAGENFNHPSTICRPVPVLSRGPTGQADRH